jgi:hypothetical protein
VLQAGRQQVGLGAPHEDRIGRLLADEARRATLARHPLGLDDLRSGERRRSDVSHLALPNEVGECLHGLFQRCLVVIAMGLVDVDMVGLQAGQGAIRRLHDVLAG